MINPILDPEWDAFKELFPYLNYNAYKKLKDFFKYGYKCAQLVENAKKPDNGVRLDW
jgi:hypothetical protein